MAYEKCYKQPQVWVYGLGDVMRQADFSPVLLAALFKERFLNIQSSKRVLINTGPWQRNFVDVRFLQFHMFPAVWRCTTTIGLLELNIRVRLKVTFKVT